MAFNRSPTILMIRKLPPDLSNEEAHDLLRYFGARSTSVMSPKGHMKGTAFAEFSTREEAEIALRKLHQAPLFGSRLVVQYSDKNYMPVDPIEQNILPPNPPPAPPIERNVADDESKNIPDTLLHYLYPPPTTQTLNNISHALVSVPQFYIQVLHLMNKMNLPPPFSKSSEKSIFDDQETVAPPLPSSSESELESDHEPEPDETEKLEIEKEILEEKRIATQVFIETHLPESERKRKRVCSEDTPDVKHTKVGEKDGTPAVNLESVDMELSDHEEPSDPVIPVPPPPPPEESSVLLPVEIPGPSETVCHLAGSVSQLISDKESEFNRFRNNVRSKCLQEEAVKDLKVFKNYNKGEPSTKLYIKNLNHKQVQESDISDLFNPYHKYFESDESIKLNIKLMTRGQMKGQSFVTFSCVESAEAALTDLHGYELRGKPMVIMFAKSK